MRRTLRPPHEHAGPWSLAERWVTGLAIGAVGGWHQDDPVMGVLFFVFVVVAWEIICRVVVPFRK